MGSSGNGFRIGEFAKLCDVTKDTLFHYEKMNLLKPQRMDSNGYRFYGAEQFFYMEMIKCLKESGLSLQQICEFKEEYNATQYLKMLQQQKEYLKVELQRIQRLYDSLSDSIRMTMEAMHKPLDEPKIIALEEDYLITWRVDGEARDPQIQVVAEADTISSLLKYCSRLGIKPAQPLGSIVSKQNLIHGKNYSDRCYFHVSEPLDDDHFLLRPRGRYLTMLHKGLYDGSEEAYQILHRYITDHGLRICGDGYESELIGYLGSGRPEDFIIRYEIPVEEICSCNTTQKI